MSIAKPPVEPSWAEPPKAKGSALKWILIGCGGFLLLMVVLCGGVSIWTWRWVSQQVAQVTQEFEAKGYAKQIGQVIEVKNSPANNTVYACQVLKITENVNVNIAAVCQIMEVEANIHGDVDFLGQVLKVHSGCVIDGDLRVKNAQVVEINGEVKGKVSGNYMVLNQSAKNDGSELAPSAPQDEANSKTAEAAPEKAAPQP
jgi:hypothetical protein